MEKEIRNEVKGLLKIGLPENIAIITACANKGKPEMAQQYLEELNDEQQEIQSFLKQLIPVTEAIKLQEEPSKLIQSSDTKSDDKNNEMTITEN
tara:strand:- start:2056 stop:2337 length:282 start_codon:yes stop_codon:yes gene_type:complete